MLFRYFTFWILLLVIFHKITHKIFSLPFLTFTILITALYISYINPAKYYFPYNDITYEITGYPKLIIDIIFHFATFLYIYRIYGYEPFFNNIKIVFSLILVLIYNLLNCASNIYHLSINEIIIVSNLSILMYILFGYLLIK